MTKITKSIAQNSPPNKRLKKLSIQGEGNCQKPQVISIPGTSPKDPYRYRVTLGSKAIASELTADDAAKLANLIKQQRLTDWLQFLQERGIVSEEALVFLLSAIGGGK